LLFLTLAEQPSHFSARIAPGFRRCVTSHQPRRAMRTHRQTRAGGRGLLVEPPCLGKPPSQLLQMAVCSSSGGNQGSAKHSALPASTRHVLACLAGAFHRALASGEASGEASDLSTLDVAEADKTDAAPEFAGPHQHGKVSCDVMPHHPISVVDAETAVSQPDPVPCRWRTMWQTRLAFRQTQPVPRPCPHQHSPLETKENRREKSDDPSA
jgi:hypothetical protein